MLFDLMVLGFVGVILIFWSRLFIGFFKLLYDGIYDIVKNSCNKEGE